MRSYMGSARIAALRRTVQDFLDSKRDTTGPGSIPFSELSTYTNNHGWRTVDSQMFKEWVQANFTDRRIHYGK